MRLGSSLERRRKKRRTSGGDGSRGSRRRRRRTDPVFSVRGLLVWLGLGVGGAILGFFLATFVLFPAPPPPEDLVQVPDLGGESLEGALDSLEPAALRLGAVDYLRHPQVDSGTVMGQSPLPGQLAAPGDSVRVTVSLGSERRAVPQVSTLRGDRAVSLLRATGFQVRVDSLESLEPRGTVLAVEPEEGAELALPGEVHLRVSLGPPAVVVPDLLSLTEGEARDSLAVLGLVVAEVEEIFRFGRDQGRVVAQDPPPGEEVERGSAVRLTVGRRGGGQDH